ncbi:MAG: hypothetical protein ACW98D_01380 [Promethearchaeota archaeon]|jgi:hypothetical protein
MLESIPKEIIGIAYVSEWDHIKQFVKALLSMTLDSKEEYSLIALNAIINNKRYEEYDVQIKSKAQIKLLSSITDFEKISLYQYSEYKRNNISISKDKNVIVFTAQYMDPEIDHTNYFDFAIYLDSFDLPYFSDNKGNVFGCQEIMEIIHRFKPKASKKVKKPEPSKKLNTIKSEVETYEKITKKNAIWNGSETKTFQKWKMRVHKEFREKTGGFPYYKGKITQKYELYLNSFIKKPISKKTPPRKPKIKKSSVKRPNTKGTVDKKKPTIKNLTPLNLEVKIYEKITKKNAMWIGSETKTFQKWKMRVHKEFREKTGGFPYYKGKITQKYELYLNNLIKKPISKKVSPKTPKIKKSTVKRPTTKGAADKKKPTIKTLTPLNFEAKIYEKLTGKNPIYGGRITKTFENWKLKIHKKFQQKVSGKPYYKGALTQKYKKYLSSL